MANSNMKDFSSFNVAYRDLGQSQQAIAIQKALQASQNVEAAVSGLPTEYARAYSGVITQEYDANNHVTDVTPAEPRTTVDYLITAAKNRFDSAVSTLNKCKAIISDTVTVHLGDLSNIRDQVYPSRNDERYIVIAINGNNSLCFDLITCEFKVVLSTGLDENEKVSRDKYSPKSATVNNHLLIVFDLLINGSVEQLVVEYSFSNNIYTLSGLYTGNNYPLAGNPRFGFSFDGSLSNTAGASMPSSSNDASANGFSLESVTAEASIADLIGLCDPSAMSTALNNLL